MKKSITDRILLFVFILPMLFFVFTCRSKSDLVTSIDKNEAGLLQEGFIKAEIKNYDVDGCGFLIFLEDGKKLYPLELSDEFKKEGLKIWIRYSVIKGAMTTCMAGEVISVLEIRIR